MYVCVFRSFLWRNELGKVFQAGVWANPQERLSLPVPLYPTVRSFDCLPVEVLGWVETMVFIRYTIPAERQIIFGDSGR